MLEILMMAVMEIHADMEIDVVDNDDGGDGH